MIEPGTSDASFAYAQPAGLLSSKLAIGRLVTSVRRNKSVLLALAVPAAVLLFLFVTLSGGSEVGRSGGKSAAQQQRPPPPTTTAPATDATAQLPEQLLRREQELEAQLDALASRIDELEKLKVKFVATLNELEDRKAKAQGAKQSDAMSQAPARARIDGQVPAANGDDEPPAVLQRPNPSSGDQTRQTPDDTASHMHTGTWRSGWDHQAHERGKLMEPSQDATTASRAKKPGKKSPGAPAGSGNGGGRKIEPQKYPFPDPGNLDDVTAPEDRATAVRNAMVHAWGGYKQHAWGRDELKPQSRTGHDWAPGGAGFTIIDALDTLWLMELKDEFYEGVDWIRKNLNFDKSTDISFFETTIRCLAGLLSAYEFSGEEILLQHADDLGTRLLRAFDTPSGIPQGTVNLHTGASRNAGWTGGASILAEFGTVQLEFRSLAHHTGKQVFREKVDHVMDIVYNNRPGDGLYPIYMNPTSGTFQGGPVTFGALGDSFYEYLLKQYIHLGRKEERYRQMYEEVVKGVMSQLIKKSPDGLTYIAERHGAVNDKMDHLACFVPGMMALGADLGTRYEEEMQVARELARTCHEMYARYPSGLAPELVHFRPNMQAGADFYILRPEAVEAFFYMWRLTGDEVFREYSWDVFKALEKHCRVPSGGYAGVRNVNAVSPPQDDLMQSFFLAETLKYIYLTFAPEETLDLEEYVFNTEAHPLRIIG